MNLDLSFTVASIIALAALVSPLLTTCMNNHHAYRMKKLEYDEARKRAEIQRERDIYEGYVCAAGACMASGTNENYASYGSHMQLALFYSPQETRNKIIALHENLKKGDHEAIDRLLAEINSDLSAYQKQIHETNK